MNPKQRRQKRIVRHRRVRSKIFGTRARPRLSVFKSHQHVFLQLIDDGSGKTLVSASSREAAAAKGKTPKAQAAGQLLGERALKSGIAAAVFDRGGYKFHGRVKAVAEAVQKAGLKI